MGRVYLTSEFTFDAAHRLHDYDGKCSQMHGHTYKLQVTVSGRPTAGILVDFNVLKDLVNERIIEEVDHKNLTEVFRMNTTVENLCFWVWDVLCYALPEKVDLYEIKIWETPTCHAAYRGGG